MDQTRPKRSVAPGPPRRSVPPPQPGDAARTKNAASTCSKNSYVSSCRRATNLAISEQPTVQQQVPEQEADSQKVRATDEQTLKCLRSVASAQAAQRSSAAAAAAAAAAADAAAAAAAAQEVDTELTQSPAAAASADMLDLAAMLTTLAPPAPASARAPIVSSPAFEPALTATPTAPPPVMEMQVARGVARAAVGSAVAAFAPAAAPASLNGNGSPAGWGLTHAPAVAPTSTPRSQVVTTDNGASNTKPHPVPLLEIPPPGLLSGSEVVVRSRQPAPALSAKKASCPAPASAKPRQAAPAPEASPAPNAPPRAASPKSSARGRRVGSEVGGRAPASMAPAPPSVPACVPALAQTVAAAPAPRAAAAGGFDCSSATPASKEGAQLFEKQPSPTGHRQPTSTQMTQSELKSRPSDASTFDLHASLAAIAAGLASSRTPASQAPGSARLAVPPASARLAAPSPGIEVQLAISIRRIWGIDSATRSFHVALTCITLHEAHEFDRITERSGDKGMRLVDGNSAWISKVFTVHSRPCSPHPPVLASTQAKDTPTCRGHSSTRPALFTCGRLSLVRRSSCHPSTHQERSSSNGATGKLWYQKSEVQMDDPYYSARAVSLQRSTLTLTCEPFRWTSKF